MKIVKITLLNGSEVFINTDNICDIRKDLMNPEHTLIQLTQGSHKVKLSIAELLKLIGAKDAL